MVTLAGRAQSLQLLAGLGHAGVEQPLGGAVLLLSDA